MDSSRGAGSWHLWTDATPRPGYTNMAVDLALLDRTERSGESWLRLYQWEPHCLSFGRNEPAARRYDAARIQRLGLPTVRRPTGGRAVWHAYELTYAVSSPTLCFSSAAEAYIEIHDMLRQALASIGVQGSLAPRLRRVGLEAGSCFSSAAGGEVLVQDSKVVGSAQLRRQACFLQHGSIMLQGNQSLVDSLQCGRSAPSPDVKGGITVPLGRSVTPEEMAEAVARTATSRWASYWVRESHPDEVLDAAARYFPRFRSAQWTWNR
ncbi:MAG TPA: hypothetical protein VFD73_24665 [Gemmatimonadales bacterium]|nr:hypothetical protein [Gemmatimonadales bacterium]